uniref:Protocadherin mu7 n=1 Tax=Callorhinchus milii TaxID=7868 RepID=B0YN83_CALMI|nr:protocadherin mu7 [Callorhinchus milii]
MSDTGEGRLLTELSLFLYDYERKGREFRQTMQALPTFFLLCAWNIAYGQIRYSIPEELKHGAFVGNVGKDVGLDEGELPGRRLRIMSAAKKRYLEINEETGILFVNELIDRERLCGQNPACFVNVEVVAENPLELYRVEVEILDINDNPPRFPSDEFHLEIMESAPPGTRFLLQSAHDPDVGVNSIHHYRLSPNEHFALEVQSSGDDSRHVYLVLENHLDREQKASHHLLLTAIDGGTPERSGTTQVIISVLDVNDNAPVFDQTFYKINLKENVPVGTIVTKLNATDVDENINSEIKYSFSNLTPKRVGQLFSIEPKTGEIRVKGAIDFEEANVYEIIVEAKDNGAIPVHCTVWINIIDVNDNAPDVTLISVTNSIPEDAETGTVIALISVSDQDSGDNGRASCRLPSNLPFELKSTFTNSYTLVTRYAMDRETMAEYHIDISCRDMGTPPLSSNATIQIQVSDINDNPPRFSENLYTVHAMENNPPGASVGSVSALDPDMGQNAHLSYSVLESQVGGMPVSSFVSINSDNGIIFSQRSFDYEELKNFQVHVQVQDAGFPPLRQNATVNVVVLDQNDNAPVIISPLVKNGSGLTIPRSADPGYLVTKVIAVDADSGQNARLAYQLSGATDRNLFTIGSNSGEIRTIRPLRDRDASTQLLVIVVKDNGHPSLSTTTTVRLSVLDGETEVIFGVPPKLKPTEESSEAAFYIIIPLATITMALLVALIALAIAICHTDRSAHGSGCCVTWCCCLGRRPTNERFQNPTLPNSRLVKNVVEVRGTGALAQTYSYTIRSVPGTIRNDSKLPPPFCAVPVRNQSHDADRYLSEWNMKGMNNTSLFPDQVGQLNTDWRSSEPYIASKISSQYLEENLAQDEIKREFNRRHTAITSAADAGYIEASPDLEDGIPTWAPRYGSQQLEHQEPDEYQPSIYMGGSPVRLPAKQDQVAKLDGQQSASSTKKKKKRSKRTEKRESKVTVEEPQNE